MPQDHDLDVKASIPIQNKDISSHPDEPMYTNEPPLSSEFLYTDELLVSEVRATESIAPSRTTCATSCIVHAPKISVVSWVPEDKIIYTADITVGIVTTLVILCNDVVVATRTQTEYHWDAAPAGMYPPYSTTNDFGNAVAIAAFTDAATTSIVEMVYPNSHIAYDSQFSWEGVIDISHYDDNPGVCVTATSELSTTYLESHGPFSRNKYLEPTATRANGSDISGRGYQPLWVALDSQPPESFFSDLRIVFYGLMQDIHTYGAWLGCNITASVSPTQSVFREARYSFDHRTMSIDLDVSGVARNGTSSGLWRNDTRSGTLCMDHVQQFAGLCEMPEVRATPDQCVVTVWNDSVSTGKSYIPLTGELHFEQTQTGWDTAQGGVPNFMYSATDWDRPGATIRFTNSEGDRSGFFMRSTTGFETVNNLEETTAAFMYAKSDWITDGVGGVLTISESQNTQPYIKGGTEERVGSWSRPQRTQPPTSPGTGLEPIESQAINKYFKAHPEFLAQPNANAKPSGAAKVIPISSDTNKAYRLDALGSVINRIFYHSTPATHMYIGAPVLDADRDESKHPAPTSIERHPLSIAAEQLVNTVEKGSPSLTVTTTQEFPYIQIPTIVDTVPTIVAGYMLPVTSTVMADQQVVINGKTTMLTPPALLPTYLSTTFNGIPTSNLGYIVSGWSTATIGQTVTFNGRPTVLAVPDAVFTKVPTVINGFSTAIPAYIISGSYTAGIGHNVTLGGTPTMLALPDLVPTYIATTVSGVVKSGLAYIITGSMTATAGQTLPVEGGTTVLAEPTSQSGAVESGAQGQWGVFWSATLLWSGVFFLICL
jgi:hypothetical protein